MFTVIYQKDKIKSCFREKLKNVLAEDGLILSLDFC